MVTTNDMAEIACLIGDPGRAAMLQALMDGRALTAGELSRAAGLTPQTASGHLAQLTRAGLLAVNPIGRHRYHRLASPEIAHVLESLMQVAALARPARRVAIGPRDNAMCRARTCYDHLAGWLGVAITDALVTQGFVELSADAAQVTASGEAFFRRQAIVPDGSTRPSCKPCLDWSERRPHLSGQLGRALCQHCLNKGWVRRREGTRALEISVLGERSIRAVFGVVAQATMAAAAAA